MGKVIIVKYAQRVLHNKGLLSMEKDFSRALAQLGKDISSTLVSLVFLSNLRENTVTRIQDFKDINWNLNSQEKK